MNKTCLACQVHSDCRCTTCGERWCSECTLVINPMYTKSYTESPLYICLGCYRKSPISKVSKNGTLTLRELFKDVREAKPKGYLSITASIDDHRPGVSKPHVNWDIYHEDLGHCEGKNQRTVYKDFCKKCNVQPKKRRKREDIV